MRSHEVRADELERFGLRDQRTLDDGKTELDGKGAGYRTRCDAPEPDERLPDPLTGEALGSQCLTQRFGVESLGFDEKLSKYPGSGGHLSR